MYLHLKSQLAKSYAKFTVEVADNHNQDIGQVVEVLVDLVEEAYGAQADTAHNLDQQVEGGSWMDIVDVDNAGLVVVYVEHTQVVHLALMEHNFELLQGVVVEEVHKCLGVVAVVDHLDLEIGRMELEKQVEQDWKIAAVEVVEAFVKVEFVVVIDEEKGEEIDEEVDVAADAEGVQMVVDAMDVENLENAADEVTDVVKDELDGSDEVVHEAVDEVNELGYPSLAEESVAGNCLVVNLEEEYCLVEWTVQKMMMQLQAHFERKY